MLIVGLFSVLTWDAAYPERRDVLVLGPLPVRTRTIFFAKAFALAIALSLTVITFNGFPGLLLPFALAPHTATILDLLFTLDFYRPLIAYWSTMLAAGTFVFCCVLIVQGIAMQLPRRVFLQLSPALQIAAFCVFVGGYFLQPSLASSEALAAPENRWLLSWLPSYWFLGLFQELNGSLSGHAQPTLVALGNRAWFGLGSVVFTSCVTFVLSYVRSLRKIVEHPDIVVGFRRLNWLPRLGNSTETAVAQFSIRTVFRSRQHRVFLSFYGGLAFAVVILFMKTPVVNQLSGASSLWHKVTLPSLASSIVVTCFWILGIRAVFAIPLELRANWIFRITQLRVPSAYLAASRRAMYVLGAVPVWLVSAPLFLFLWPWRAALEHVGVIVLLGIILTELAASSFYKIPFTCSYLPGKSNLHITFVLCLMLGMDAIYMSARFEFQSLPRPSTYLRLMTILCAAAAVAWWRRWRIASQQAGLRFEEQAVPVIAGLELHRDGILAG
jgi:hypothetical protein